MQTIQTADEHVKRCSASCIIREMQNKRRNYHNIPIGTARIWKECGELQMLETKWGNTNSNPLLVGMEMARPLERQLGDVLQNETYCYHAAQQSRALVFVPKSWRLKSTQRSLHEINKLWFSGKGTFFSAEME